MRFSGSLHRPFLATAYSKRTCWMLLVTRGLVIRDAEVSSECLQAVMPRFSFGVTALSVLLVHIIFVCADRRAISCTPDEAACASGWADLSVEAGDSIVVSGIDGPDAAAELPVVQLVERQGTNTPPTDWELVLRRLVLLDVQLSTPTSSSSQDRLGPFLWPRNAFSSVGSQLNLQDVRLVTRSAALFQQYLDFFRAQPVLRGPNNPNLHTDGRTYVHITTWSYGGTTLQSVTLMTGPCATRFDEAASAGRNLTQALAWNPRTSSSSSSPAIALVSGSSSNANGCNVMTADNSTVVPLLLDPGAISSREMLLVLLQANASIGRLSNVPAGRIKLGRPVALAGLWSVVTGIDLEMRVNQLDVTAPLAQIMFSSLVLENLATGDVTSTLVTAPYSPIATVNLYAVFCSRANVSKPCTLLQNVTLVIANQVEMDYIGYMYSMFNSQAPGAKQLTLFYAQDLLFTSLNFSVGPGPDSITVHNATSVSWRMLDVVYTTRPLLFKPLALPVRTYVDFEASRAAPLALQVSNCADLKAALEYRTIPSRLHVLLMRQNLSLARSNTPQATSIYPPPTAGMHGLLDGPGTFNITDWPAVEPAPSCLGPRMLVAYRTQIRGLLRDNPSVASPPEVRSTGALAQAGFATLDFAYTRNALVLPSDQVGQLTFYNMVLGQLPQGGTPAELASAAHLPYMLPPEAWTLLLWSVNSTLTQRALHVRNSALKLPEPEFKHLVVLARLSKAFIVELAGHPDALTFKDTSEHGNHIHAGWYEGPGVMGQNVTFFVDTEEAPTRLNTYWWPADYQPLLEALQHQQPQSKPAAQVSTLLLAILVPVVSVLVIAAVLAAVLLRRRHRRQLQGAATLPLQGPQTSDKPFAGAVSGHASSSGPHSSHSSSHRSSAEVSRPANSSGGVSTSDRSELRVDVEQLMHMGVHGPAGSPVAVHDMGLQLTSTAACGGGPSPSEHRVRFHGFPPVIEGSMGAATGGFDSEVGCPLPPRSVHRSASSCSNTCLVSSATRASEHPKAHSSATSSSRSEQQDRQQQPCGVSTAGTAPDRAARAGQADASNDLASSVASGLEKWRAVVSTTTMQLAERRLAGQAQVASAMTAGGFESTAAQELPQAPSGASSAAPASCSSSSSTRQRGQLPGDPAGQQRHQQQTPSVSRGQSSACAAASASSGALVLKRVLGRGSQGEVWAGVFRGMPVAVKIMHLPTTVLEDQQEQGQQAQHEDPQQRAGQQQQERTTPPHFAVMEAVLSSQCSHRNVVQVYTYMLTPLLTTASDSRSTEKPADGSSPGAVEPCNRVPPIVVEPGDGSTAAGIAAEVAAAAAACAANGLAKLSGWQVQVIMELCEEGTLRTALDKGMLKQPGAAYMDPALALLLARDVAAAMLHLHSEGVVHGDLKAANVMLAAGGADPDGLWAATIGRPLIAKIADFGLAISLPASDSHATLTARGTPPYMSPELFLSGRVSKACDSYAYSMLLYEIITGQRPFSGVPLPLLPHEVAVKALRPDWPSDLPGGFRQLQALAEACWQQEPDRRPVFADILDTLDQWEQQQPQQQGPLPNAQLQQLRPHDLLRHALQQPQVQWRQPIRHSIPLDVSDPVQQGRPAGPSPSRAGQFDWSEVSFELLGNPPAQQQG